MKKTILIFTFLVAFISCAFTQVIDLSPEAARYDLKVLNTNITSAYCSEYQAVYDVLTTKPSDAIATAQNTMVKSLVDGGYWPEIDIFYLLAQTVNSGGEAYPNWKNPGTYDLTEILGGGSLSFVANEGIMGDGTAVLNTNWNPNIHGSKFVQNSAGLLIGVYTDATHAGYIAGAYDGTNYSCLIRPRDGANTVFIRINANAVFENVANASSKKHFSLRRTGATTQRLGINKVHTAKSGASVGVPNTDLYVLGYNNNGSPAGQNSVHRIMYLVASSGFNDSDSDAIVDIIETYLDTNGKGLLP